MGNGLRNGLRKKNQPQSFGMRQFVGGEKLFHWHRVRQRSSKIWATCDRNMPGKCLVLKEITERDGTYMIHDIAKDRIIPSSLVHFILKRILKVCICFIETPLFRHHMKLLIMKLWRVQQAWADLNFLEHSKIIENMPLVPHSIACKLK